jgi:hypothetical protein
LKIMTKKWTSSVSNIWTWVRKLFGDILENSIGPRRP